MSRMAWILYILIITFLCVFTRQKNTANGLSSQLFEFVGFPSIDLTGWKCSERKVITCTEYGQTFFVVIP